MMTSPDPININGPAENRKVLYAASLGLRLPGDLGEISLTMDLFPRYQLLNHSWPRYQTICRAYFAIAYTAEAILIKYFVINDYFKSVSRGLNEAVHKDNCVEFFVSFGPDDAYYNIEFNCLGNGKMAYGKPGAERKLLSEKTIRKIRVLTNSSYSDGKFDWDMTFYIPFSVFKFSGIKPGNELLCRANFYKCGDDLPDPHYLSWQKIKATDPDFHRPEFFGNIVFESAEKDEDKMIINNLQVLRDGILNQY
jgi:hypothetical protein